MKVYTLDSKPQRPASGYGSELYRAPYLVKGGMFLLTGTALTSPMYTGSGMGMGVFAAEPCVSGGAGAERVDVTPTTDLNITSIFDCEGGDFEVYWSGEVSVSSTIFIGSGTTVRIFGDGNYSNEGNSSLSDQKGLEELTSGLALPLGLTSAAVGAGQPNITVNTDERNSFGPMFYVDGGELHLQDLIVRQGFASNTTDGLLDGIGGGVYAMRSNVTITRCEFNDNFAENLGGGIFANESTLQVFDSIFRYCEAGFLSTIEDDEDLNGAGGGIAAETTEVLIDGCLFEGGYANGMGGGMSLKNGHMSVVGSVFYGNVAGGDNIENEDQTGEGAGLSVSGCLRSFDGLAACGVNDTVFQNSRVATNGGAVALGSGSGPWSMEFHRCTIHNSSTGLNMKDDPQGEGGALSLGEGVTLLLSDCIITSSYCGKKGGVISLSGGDDWTHTPGATVVMRNSSFQNNMAAADNGGVVNMGDYATAVVEGDDNVFEGNECGVSGGVFAATSETWVVIEGGAFIGNACGENGGVFWVKGNLSILGGTYLGNGSPETGGVLFYSEGSQITIEGGIFEDNWARDGGVALVDGGTSLRVESGIFSGNVANGQGGVFAANSEGDIQITGGNFTNNAGDNGGFLYKIGEGTTSCTGASILQNKAVDGGAIHAVDGATLDWACDTGENSAISGPAIYARTNTTVVIQGASLFDNTLARGSTVFVVDSILKTYQVKFIDSFGALQLSAVEIDQDSSYMAEETSFTGFAGEVVVTSGGELFLDDCDFSGSTASRLVYSEPGSTLVIRNAVLGDNNFGTLAAASSKAGELPTATSLTNANPRCGRALEESGAANHSTRSSPHYPCCEGSTCVDGDLGVYCQCYLQTSSSTEKWTSGDTTALRIAHEGNPDETVFPALLESDVLLSYEPSAISSATRSSSSSSDSGNDGGIGSEEGWYGDVESGVVWSVEAFTSQTKNMNWTIFPSTGQLLLGQSVTVRVVTRPGADLDGTTNVTFAVISGGPQASTSSSISLSRGNDDFGNPNSAAAYQGQAWTTAWPSQGGNHSTLEETPTTQAIDMVSFDVTYFHCGAGSFWNRTASSVDEGTDTCPLCTDGVEGETAGVDCTEAGGTIGALRINEGYWRATLETNNVRECSNEDACQGGSVVQSVQEYCNDGYEGVVCSVCSSGYGRGASEQCHLCTSDFKGAMYFVIAVVVVLMLVVVALLAVYLVRGRDAVSSTVASTRESVRVLRRRGAGILSRSDGGGCADFGRANVNGATSKEEFTCDTEDQPRGTAGESLTLNDNSVGCLSQDNGESFATSTAVPANTDLQHEVQGLPNSTGHTPVVVGGKKTVPNGGLAPPPTLEAQNREPSTNGHTEGAGVVADSSGVDTTERNFIAAYAGPAAEGGQGPNEPSKIRRSQNINDGGVRTKTSSTTISDVLAGLPLSKVKIVIVVWQISSAFAEVTNVTFPPIYETFLSIIGVFSLDLGWILSATCLASEVDFYDKLLIVTIGPMILLGLLGITFHIGARSTQRVRPKEPGLQTRRSFRTPTEVSLPVWTKRTTFPATMPEAISTSPQTKPHTTVGALGAQARAPRAGGVAGEHTPPGKSADAALGLHDNWSCGVSIEGETEEEESARVPSIPPGPVERAMGASTGSLRSIWKAGPGNKTNPDQNQLWGLFARHTTMFLIILYLVYSQVSTVVFQAFSCEDYHEINKRYLRTDGRIECDTTKHRGFMAYAAVMICLYPLGIPAVFCYLLVRQRPVLNPSTDKRLEESRGTEFVVREKINKREKDQSVKPTSFLWGAYYPNRYYYEVFECMRRLLLTGLLVFVPDTSGQVAYGCIFAFISLWAFELQRPHIDALEIQLYRAGCLVIFFTNFLALIIQAELAEEDSKSSTVYAVVLIMVHVFFIMSICWNSWATMRATFSKGHFQGVVLGVDIIGEDSADSPLASETAKEGQAPSEDEGVRQDDGGMNTRRGIGATAKKSRTNTADVL